MLIGMVTDLAVKLFVCGLVWHWFADWILQNHWQAQNKVSLLHPASWVHSGIHFLGLLLIFSPAVALAIALIHLLIDTRVPLVWWRKFYRQTTTGDVALHVQIWSDQVSHILAIAIAALVVGGLR